MSEQPYTPWHEVVGHRCAGCGGDATHIHDGRYQCCVCHGGEVISPDMARLMHEDHAEREARLGPSASIEADELRALLRQALPWVEDVHTFLDAGDPEANHVRAWIATVTLLLEDARCKP